ncbi:MAG TPA: phage holin family protein, partial [Nocardioides sp.]|nr:phage holin family protein [Nocardioides sp.]
MTAQHGAPEGQTLGALVHQLSQQVPGLIRPEIRLAQAEVTENGKRAGVGIGMFSVAGLLAFFAVAAFVTTAILGLAY